jgi:hypothetical protein
MESYKFKLTNEQVLIPNTAVPTFHIESNIDGKGKRRKIELNIHHPGLIKLVVDIQGNITSWHGEDTDNFTSIGMKKFRIRHVVGHLGSSNYSIGFSVNDLEKIPIRLYGLTADTYEQIETRLDDNKRAVWDWRMEWAGSEAFKQIHSAFPQWSVPTYFHVVYDELKV